MRAMKAGRIHFYGLPLVLAFLFLLSLVGASATVPISANVLVLCPFSLTLNTLPVYVTSNTLTLNYTVFAQKNCVIPYMSGNFELVESNSIVILTLPESFNIITPTAVNVPFSVNIIGVNPGNYIGVLSMTSISASNTSSSNFEIINPANIILTNFTVSTPVASGALLQISLDLSNNGQFASNSINVNVIVSGASSFQLNYSEPALSPGQMESVLLTVNGHTTIPGTYNANASAQYVNSNGVLTRSNSNLFTYTVSAPPSPAPSGGSSGFSGGTPPAQGPYVLPVISALSFIDMPLYTSIAASGQVLQNIGIQNNGASTENVSISVPSAFAKFVKLSASSVSIAPDTVIYIEMAVNTSSKQQGLLIIPLNISTIRNGQQINVIQYSLVSVTNSSSTIPSITSQITLQNSTQLATVDLKFTNTKSTPVRNATLTSYIPIGAVANISSIYAYGLPSNVTIQNNTYVVKFSIPYVSSNQVVSMYYQIRNPRSQTLLTQINSNLVQQYSSNSTTPFSIFDITVPTLYAQTLSTLSAYLLYTGTVPRQVYVTLIAPSGVTLKNSTEIFTVQPNQLINPRFNFSTGTYSGTILFNLKMYSGSWNVSYYIPGVVLPGKSPPPQQTQGQGTGFTSMDYLIAYSIPAIIVIGYIANALQARIRVKRVHVVHDLTNLRAQIKREAGNQENE